MKKNVVDAFRIFLSREMGAVGTDLIHLMLMTVGAAMFFHGTFFPSALDAASVVVERVKQGMEQRPEGAGPSMNRPRIVEW